MGNVATGLCDVKGPVCSSKLRAMDGKGSLSDDVAFKALQDYYNKNGDKLNIPQMFKEDADRFQKFRYVMMLVRDYASVHSLTSLCYNA